ncbi:MAG: fucose isomerase, partial [Anaerolineae bacterium]|nr:fucose isomerase [Anaerolineae bacterium]
MNPSLRIGFVPIARPTFDTVLAAQVTDRMRRALLAEGCDLIGPADLVMDAAAAQTALAQLQEAPLDLLLLFQASFADSSLAAELARAIAAPVMLWAVPEERTGGRLRLNSFCGINLAGHALKRAGIFYRYVYAQPEDAAGVRKLLVLARAGRVRRLLKTLRIGRVGQNPTGFEPCTFDGDALAQRFGVQVVPCELADFFGQVRHIAPEQSARVLAQLAARVSGLEALDHRGTLGTAAVYLALHHLAADEHFGGLAVRCWPEFFTELGCA